MRECNCNDFIERVFELLDAEVDGAEAEMLRAHVRKCAECTRLAEAEHHVRALLRRSCQEHAPEALRMRVHAQLTILRLGGGMPVIRRANPSA
ncbi:MAG TPA: mycothiol system anti-sigma-R factor [Actinomycetaceae bacterium]|nr:mycothiol system anti-sigma-R factor [Actinomycetaceae bacterium]